MTPESGRPGGPGRTTPGASSAAAVEAADGVLRDEIGDDEVHAHVRRAALAALALAVVVLVVGAPLMGWPRSSPVRRGLGHAGALASQRAGGPCVLGDAARLLSLCALPEPPLAPCAGGGVHRGRSRPRAARLPAAGRGWSAGERDRAGF